MPAPTNIQQIGNFFHEIRPWARAYRGRSFDYFGIETDVGIQLCVARIRLQAQRATDTKRFRFGRYAAGSLPLVGDIGSVRKLVDHLATSEPTRIRPTLTVQLPSDNHAGVYVQPPSFLHSEGLSAGRRLGVLTIQAANSPVVWDRVQTDWALKSADEPYDGVGELLVELRLGSQLPGRCTLEVVANTAVEVAAASRIDGEHARIGVWLPTSISPREASLGYRVIIPGSPTRRGSFSSRELEWANQDDSRVGMATLSVPRGAVVNCIATYAGTAHHSHWVADPAQIPNPRALALSTIDASLSILNGLLTESSLKGSAAPQFESAVAAALWASGLAPVQTGYADQSKDGPDVLAVAPNGGLVVVECTLGLLKAENKLAKLSRRTVLLRETLSGGPLAPPTILPVIVTRLSRREVEPELDAATDAGVLVLTRESLESFKHQMLLFPDGDTAFRRGLEALERERTALAERRRQGAQQPSGLPDVPQIGAP